MSWINHRLLRGMGVTGLNLILLLALCSAVAAAPAAQAAQGGNAENGRALFVDDVKLANGGPPCVSCHSINDVGLLGGGAFGPDLTQASIKYGDAGLATAIANIQSSTNIKFPTMKPIYTRHPLTPAEAADLTAFIISLAGQPQVNKEGLLLIISLAGFVAAMVVAAVYWRGRLVGVRRGLVERVYPERSKNGS